MTDRDFDAEAIIDAMAPFLGLTVEPAYREGVVEHLTAARAIAQSVLDFDTGDEAEPAPVFVA